jgi:hypothetical protein
MSAFFKRHWFALALAAGMIAFELILTALLAFGQPAGWRWLGATLQTPNDVAVYLSEIAEGRALLYNPYVVEPHALRFDPIWSILGMIHGWTGASPLLLHEIARVLFTVILAFALIAAARSVADTEANARLATLLMVGGIGLGWLHAVILGVFHLWTPETFAAPDLIKEFAVAPTLVGGAHTILSFALLVTAVRGVWKSAHDRTRASGWICAAIVLLTSFQPYFIPLIAAVISMAWTKKLGRRPAHERTHRPAIAFLLSLIPGTAYYLWLLQDTAFGTHHLKANIIPFPPIVASLFAIAPALVALVWLARRHDREQRFLAVGRWCVAWLVAAVILFFLPVPWAGKFIEALMVPLVLLTLPAWTMLFKKMSPLSARLLLIFIVGATPLFLICSNAAWLRNPVRVHWLGQPESVFHAWSFLKTHPRAIVMADDMWVNVWTPAWSGNTVYVGHPHETLDYVLKEHTWQIIMTGNSDDAVRALNNLPVTDIILTSQVSAERMLQIAPNWHPVFHEGQTTVLERL